MNGLLASIVRIQAGEKCLQIVLVHSSVEAVHSFKRHRLRVSGHSILLALPDRRSQAKEQ